MLRGICLCSGSPRGRVVAPASRIHVVAAASPHVVDARSECKQQSRRGAAISARGGLSSRTCVFVCRVLGVPVEPFALSGGAEGYALLFCLDLVLAQDNLGQSQTRHRHGTAVCSSVAKSQC